MTKDEIRGKWEKFKGRIKEEWGSSTADRKTQAEGVIQQGMGSVQEKVGKVIDDLEQPARKEPVDGPVRGDPSF